MRDQFRVALVGAEMRRERERDVEPVGRQTRPRRGPAIPAAPRPLGWLVEAELGKLARVRHAIEVGMHHREARQLVGLHQREGRARHLDRGIVGEMADQRARERGLAGAEIARQRDEIAGLEHGRDVDREALRRALVRKHDREAGRG